MFNVGPGARDGPPSAPSNHAPTELNVVWLEMAAFGPGSERGTTSRLDIAELDPTKTQIICLYYYNILEFQ